MNQQQNRKLAAILFADIVGYTALMQSNEPEALAALHKFKTELETQVPNHKGEIIQFYGDGCLVVFNSSVDAVTCAKKLQLAFQSEPKVPVRIGLHAGDVVFKEANVFGDAVNIASRVESMGISGAVLLSSNVRNQIKNQPEFDLVSLGKFEFKNVVEGMTVYALKGEKLVIPNKDDIKGKLKEPVQTKPKRNWLWSLPLLLIVSLFGLYQWYQTNNANKFEATILKERIAVLPFKNNTNNPELDILGDMAADWINQGLMDIGEAEVVSPFTVRTHRDAIGILENDPGGRPSFAELTGAKNLITGNFYQEKDELIFKLEIVDALVGNLRFGLGAIRGKETDKEELITKLREQIMGYWAARDMVDTKKIKAPKYEAYEIYFNGLENTNETPVVFFESLVADSTFHLSRLHFLNLNRQGIYGKTQPHFEFLERHFNQLTEYEKSWFAYLKAFYLGKSRLAFNSLNKLRLKYPKDFILNHETAVVASQTLNNPELALTIYEALPIQKSHIKNAGLYYHLRIQNKAICLFRLERFKDLEQFINLHTRETPKENFKWIYAEPLLLNDLVNQEGKNLQNIYLEYCKPFKDMLFIHSFNIEASNLFPNNFRQFIIKEYLTYDALLPKDDLFKIIGNNYVAWKELKPNSIVLNNLAYFPQSAQILNLLSAGSIYIETDQIDSLKFIFQNLQKLTESNYEVSAPFGNAFAWYAIGRLESQMGEPELALITLKKARNLGFQTLYAYYQYDRYLTSLYDLPEFQELLQPIWPEVKN